MARLLTQGIEQALRAAAVAYAITAVFGAPACQTYRSQWAVAEYKRLRAAGNSHVWESHPRIATYAAIPILPAVVLEYHEYQLVGLYGFSGPDHVGGGAPAWPISNIPALPAGRAVH